MNFKLILHFAKILALASVRAKRLQGSTPKGFSKSPKISEFGFREYDARWLYPEQINLSGIKKFGESLGILMSEEKIKPEIIFHLAAQPLVSTSYDQPLETIKTNIIGTSNLLSSLENKNYEDAKDCHPNNGVLEHFHYACRKVCR